MEKKEKKITKQTAKPKAITKPRTAVKPKVKYIEAIGRRKTSIARVRVYPENAEKGSYHIDVNGIPFETYFPLPRQHAIVCDPFKALDISFETTVAVSGGGINSQAEAVRHGIARAIVKYDSGYRGKIKALGYLRRDPRMVERKKFGSRKARRPQQWRKR